MQVVSQQRDVVREAEAEEVEAEARLGAGVEAVTGRGREIAMMTRWRGIEEAILLLDSLHAGRA